MNVTSSSNGSACGLFVSRVPEIDTTHRWTLESSSPLPDLLRSGPNLCQPVTPEDKATYSELAPRYGPCSRSWELKPVSLSETFTYNITGILTVFRTQKSRKQTKSKASNRNPKSKVGVGGPSAGRRRGAFTDDRKRELTAQTRELKGCIRCRMHRVRCWPDPNNVNGSCLTCQRVTGPTICKLPCLRYIISDASVYREQAAPYQLFSKRWQNMELIDITTWASEETKTIVISQIFLDAPYQVKVKEFVPVEGDMLEEQWNSGSVVKSHKIPRYALADMEETAQMLQDFIDKSVAKYILGALAPRNSGKTEDELLYYTYMAAFKHIHEAKVKRSLLQDCFRLWVGCRKTSNPHHISGDDKLGGEKVDDPSSPFFECVPMPVIMIAQMECIMYTKILRPLSKKVLDSLNDLVKDNKRKYWLTIYFTIFILLHSCSMITKRDEETAKQYGLQARARYANLRSIQGHHAGAKTMLAHFHWLNKGALPFSLAVDSGNVAKLMAEAELTAEQSEFVHRTAFLVQERATLMKTIREEQEFGHDFYWISQLYDEEWLPGPSA
ncbi:hypothetical protein BDZ45DRAFT_608397 [Acephala macrosclerotiorum]|nr:hypothetical protein BDZ45DRAFT_608397 [Acephala macrosclerotiorum]